MLILDVISSLLGCKDSVLYLLKGSSLYLHTKPPALTLFPFITLIILLDIL